MCGVPQTTPTTATKNVLEWAAHGEKRAARWKEMGGDVRAAQNLWDMHTIDEKIKFEAKGYTREAEVPAAVAPAAPTGDAPPADPAAKLEQLEDLRDKGLISQEEYGAIRHRPHPSP